MSLATRASRHMWTAVLLGGLLGAGGAVATVHLVGHASGSGCPGPTLALGTPPARAPAARARGRVTVLAAWAADGTRVTAGDLEGAERAPCM